MTPQRKLIYLDNAATSWPKPAPVVAAMTRFSTEIGANPGRSGHRLSVEAARTVFSARLALAELFNAPDPLKVVFGLNGTEALNLAILGLLKPGDHAITSGIEHNSVMRPLRWLESLGTELTTVSCTPEGFLNPETIRDSIRENTVLVIITHASNVMGTLTPIAEISQILHRQSRPQPLLLVDCAQTAGAIPIDIQRDGIDLLAFTGHKSLYGPMGTGGLVLGERVDIHRLAPLKRGGTGSRSELEQQPEFAPDQYESGTPNAIGLAGLCAGVGWVQERGVGTIREHELSLTRRLITGLMEISGVTLYGSLVASQQTAVVSFNIDSLEPSEVGLRLDEEYNLLCRVGLHCAPAAHHTMGTFPRGTVRISMGAFNTQTDIDACLLAVKEISRGATK